jgi:hypothetical protein
VAFALAGCGGGEQADTQAPRPKNGPAPTESLQQAIDRIGAVAKAGDCGRFHEIYHPDADQRDALCPRMLPDIVPGARAPRQFSEAAALMYSTTGKQTILVLDRDGRYKVGVTLGSKLPAESPRIADLSMADVVDAIRRDDCKKLLLRSLTYPVSGRKYCESEAVQVLHRGLARDPSATPVRLGGTDSWAVYGLKFVKPPGYYTLVFVATPARFFMFVGSFAAA